MAPSLLSQDTVAVVTGSNRGIGYEIVRLLAEQGLTVVLTSRDVKKGQAAVDSLAAKGLKNVVLHQLDATDSKSVQNLAEWLKSEFGGIDILINNAAGQSKNYDYEAAKFVLDANYYGVKNVISSLLPLLKSSPYGARIVNFTSRLGLYNRIPSEEIRRTFEDEAAYTEELADSLATKYLESFKEGRAEKDGWIPDDQAKVPIYSESKMFLNVYTAGLAKSVAKSQPEGQKIFVASLCPGTTGTELLSEVIKNGYVATGTIKTPADGADTAVWLALLPEKEWEGKHGKLFGERSEYPFGLTF